MTRRLIPILLLGLVPAAALAQPAKPAQEEDKPVTKAELTAELDADYANLDADQDGKATTAEIEARLNRGAQAELDEIKKKRDAAFARFDADGNGAISRAEFDAQAKLPALPKPDASPLLAQFDTDKDGAISKEEFRAPTLANFERLDVNKDGTLSVAEQQKAAAVTKVPPKSTPPIGR